MSIYMYIFTYMFNLYIYTEIFHLMSIFSYFPNTGTSLTCSDVIQRKVSICL